MNFKRKNNKQFGKKKARAFQLKQWSRQTHRRDVIIEEIKKTEKLDGVVQN
jgi:hypothetical protein